MGQNGIVSATAKTIIDTDGFIDLAEFGIDDLLDDGIIKELPIIRPIISALKTTLAIKDKFMLRKLANFINELNNNTIDEKKYKDYKEKLDRKEKMVFKELEHILIIIDRLLDEGKDKILAKLYKSYINRNIRWDDFLLLSAILDRLFIKDIEVLNLFYGKEGLKKLEIQDISSVTRLISLGLIEDETTGKPFDMGTVYGIGFYPKDYDYSITSLGNSFIENSRV